MVGIISTVLLQSSTAAVAVIVALEEANAMSVQAGIFMVRHRRMKGSERTPLL